MSKGRNLDECPRCGSQYLEIKQLKNKGETILICEECGHEFKAFGKQVKPSRKNERPGKSSSERY